MRKIFENYKIASAVFAGVMGGVVTLVGMYAFAPNVFRANNIEDLQSSSKQLARYASLNTQIGFDFTGVSEIANPAVVHIKTTMSGGSGSKSMPQDMPFNPFDFFGGPGGPEFRFEQPGPQMATGSGVIISDDGYIVTNNHVIDNANKIEVVLNDKRTYIAELVGADKNTDLALLRIGENSLPFLKLGNSDQVKVGQWVVAVGNPFNLNSTVTLGIVSAMGRNIDLIRSKGNQYAIENFIQTDAAINPGNSGGALVNTEGELVGINTAIASQTGSYAGYGFAIPVNLMKKVVNDFMKYGQVQRAILGVSIQEITQELAEDKKLGSLKGVYIADVVEGGAAQKAGVKKGDVVLKIEGEEVNSSSRLQEKIGEYRPGDKVTLTVNRDGKIREIETVLLSKEGEAKLITAKANNTSEFLGMSLGNTSQADREKLGLKSGIKVEAMQDGAFKKAGIPKGFIITHINNERVYSVRGAISVLEALSGSIVVEGVMPGGEEKIFAVKLPVKSNERGE